jgi:hypothetical protein
VSTETIRRNLVAADWTKKKLELRARQRSDELRLDWLRRVAIFSAEMYVFCDESGVDRRDGARRTGWAPRGVPPWAYAALARGHRFHLLPAISVNGLIDVLLYQGHTTSEGFFIWQKNWVSIARHRQNRSRNYRQDNLVGVWNPSRTVSLRLSVRNS